MHIALLHPWRRHWRKLGKWNRAADYVINGELIALGLTLPAGGLVDHRYDGMATEQVYDLLEDHPNDGRASDLVDAPDAVSEMEAKLEVVQAARSAMMMGDTSSTLKRILAEAGDSVVDYYALMRRFFLDRAKQDYAWSRPNRRFIAQGIYLPSLYSEEMGDVGIGIDTSASIVNRELGEYFKDVNSIVSDVRPNRVWVFYCDAAVKRLDCFERGEEVIPRPVGGGGTSFVPVFEKVRQCNLDLKCLLYFTDMCGRFPTTAPAYPVMWMTKSRAIAPFGETVRIR